MLIFGLLACVHQPPPVEAPAMVWEEGPKEIRVVLPAISLQVPAPRGWELKEQQVLAGTEGQEPARAARITFHAPGMPADGIDPTIDIVLERVEVPTAVSDTLQRAMGHLGTVALPAEGFPGSVGDFGVVGTPDVLVNGVSVPITLHDWVADEQPWRIRVFAICAREGKGACDTAFEQMIEGIHFPR